MGPAPRSLRCAVAALAVAVAVVRLPYLPLTPDDLDATNFVLGIRDFDVARHQPHPPGYPLYVALGKLAVPVVKMTVADGGSLAARARNAPASSGRTEQGGVAGPIRVPEAMALGLVSALCSAVAVIALWRFFRQLGGDERRALAATVLTGACPLFFFTASRPLSDVPGLAAAAVVQALLATALRRQRPNPTAGRGEGGDGWRADWQRLGEAGRIVVVASLLAGLAAGLRSQTAVLTLPLLVLVLLDRVGRDAAGAFVGAAAALGVGTLVWAVPLVVTSGGVGGYLRVLSIQASEDFAGVEMLAMRPSLWGIVFALRETFVTPWASAALGTTVLVAAGAGLLALVVRSGSRFALAVLAAAFGPYAAFHLLFHETVTVRYALPLVPLVAYLAVTGVDRWARRLLPVATLVWTGASLVLAVPAVVAMGRTASPAYQALAELRAEGAALGGADRVLALHHAVALGLRGEAVPGHLLPTRPKAEWAEVVRQWREGGSETVWLLAETRRRHELEVRDFPQCDDRAWRLRRSYRWPWPAVPLLSGSRPGEIDLYELREPGWAVLDGWALTPEMAGIGTALGRGLAMGPITALVRRRPGPLRVMIGGRNLGSATDPVVRFEASVDGHAFAQWTAAPAPGFFLRFYELPPALLIGEGPHARLVIRAEAADGSARPVRAAIEQFDVQPATAVVYGFDTGWHELEYNPTTRRLWRWTSASAVVRVWPAGRDVRVRIRGESPLRYFATPPTVTLLAGSHVLGRWTPESDFDWTVTVPVAALERSGGRITLETTRVFVPAERSRSPDRRPLGLRIWSLTVQEVCCPAQGRLRNAGGRFGGFSRQRQKGAPER